VAQFGKQWVARSTATSTPHTVDQLLTQDTTITQVASGAGTHTASVRQQSEQRIDTYNTSGAVSHAQEGAQSTIVHQDSDDGDQSVTVDQDLTQLSDARRNSGSIIQRQNATDDGRDVFAEIRQFADEAYNTAILNQDEILRQDAKTTSTQSVAQYQGAPSGGLTGDFEGDQNIEPTETESSSYTSALNKDFRQDIFEGIVDAQVQDDIVECCDLPFGFSQSYHDCSIDGDSLLLQAPGGEQKIAIRLLGEVDRSCTASYTAETNGASDSDSQTGPRVAIGTNCDESNCEQNLAPTADDVTASGDENTVITWTPSVSDPDGDLLTCGIDEVPANGSATVASGCSTGSYTPDENFSGTDTFTYFAQDEHGFRSSSATVTITVNDVPEPAASGLTLAVKNANGSTYGTTATVSPLAPSADYRVVYTNTGEAAAQNVQVSHPVPSGGTVASCSNSCTVSGGTVSWSLGSQPGGAAVTLDVRITYSFSSFGEVTTKATGTTTGEAPFESNSVTVQKQCVGPACI
jgi:uncharacterized repeat protein (TIGR01451 family)